MKPTTLVLLAALYVSGVQAGYARDSLWSFQNANKFECRRACQRPSSSLGDDVRDIARAAGKPHDAI